MVDGGGGSHRASMVLSSEPSWVSFADSYLYICIYLDNDSPSRKASRSLTLSYPSPF